MNVSELLQSNEGRDIIMESIPTAVMDLAKDVVDKIRGEAITATDNALHFMRQTDLLPEGDVDRATLEAVHEAVGLATIDIFLDQLAEEFGLDITWREL